MVIDEQKIKESNRRYMEALGKFKHYLHELKEFDSFAASCGLKRLNDYFAEIDKGFNGNVAALYSFPEKIDEKFIEFRKHGDAFKSDYWEMEGHVLFIKGEKLILIEFSCKKFM